MQAKASSSPSQQKSTKPKSTVKPTRKSFRIATQSTQKPRRKIESSKQSPPMIEEIVSSPERSLSEIQRSALANRALPRHQRLVRAQLLQNLLSNQSYLPSRNPLPKESYLPNSLPHRALLGDLLSSLVLKG